ncbi:hypothetical protein FOZ60_007394 [Perkinsus olseni]|uniref:Uncharacterized protein n=1 Tax=Perkinsus olseni TaxID=32597 RepID=A0A7J6NMN0_PEROL|nr:hypothetical protein FOZ60_007394 [Perkinsus olseni]
MPDNIEATTTSATGASPASSSALDQRDSVDVIVERALQGSSMAQKFSDAIKAALKNNGFTTLGLVSSMNAEGCKLITDEATVGSENAVRDTALVLSSLTSMIREAKQELEAFIVLDGALEGNGCSRLLDAVYDDEIPFAASAEVYVTALKALKVVKDMCFRAWSNTGLRWTPKVHILCDHVVEYLENYEADDDVGLGLSSEQSGESLHARLQRVWNQLFKVNADNELFSQRLIDCMVTYNWNLQWDEAQRSMGGMKSYPKLRAPMRSLITVAQVRSKA